MQGDNLTDERLPQRLFATNRFPSGRLNIYSKQDILTLFVKYSVTLLSFKLLDNLILGSCLTDLHVNALFPANLFTLWTEFGGRPLRFGLQEFGTITGLPCGAYPTEKDMYGWKKVCLALILIVDGVLIAHKQTPPLKYVQMVEDLDSFFQFPWGRESFSKTVACMKTHGGTDPVGTLVKGLKQETLHLKGFPLVLQLSKIPAPFSSLLIIELEEDHLPNHPSINLNDLLLIESENNLSVSPIIPIESQPQPGWRVWPDVVNDESLFYMEQLIADKRPLKKDMWPGGDNSLPIIIRPTIHEKPVHKKSLKPKHPSKKKPLQIRRTTQKPSTAQKHRRISNYFLRTGSTSNNSTHHLFEIVSELVTKMLKRIKQCSHTKRSSVNSLPSRMQKFKKLRQKGQSQSAQPLMDAPRDNTILNPADNGNDLSCHSPILSQYVAQHHRSALANTQDEELPLQNSLDHTSPIHTSPSPDHKYPIHVSPVHHSPTPVMPLEDSSIHTSSVHVVLEGQLAPSTTSQPRHSEIYDSSTHPNSSPLHHLLFHCVEIFDLLSPITQTQLTPNPSPTKSTDTGSGSASHATSVNAFSATTTSSRMPSLNSTMENHQECLRESEVMELSDLSPTRETITHSPSEAENHLATKLMSCSSHMEILMAMLAERHNQLLARERLLFCTPYLTSIIQQKWRKFKATRRKDIFHWDKRLSELVTSPGNCWMEDVFTIYTPMIWADRHWAGLAINLDLGLVKILDPLSMLYSDSRVAGFTEPVLTSLSHLVKKFADPQQTQICGLEPFAWSRIQGLYIKERSGDCGPVSVKLLEMHTHRDPEPHMSSFTDDIVDDFCKQYTMDIYKSIVLPAYHPPIN
ncbi:hypothetical protein N665_0054s0060 [Sinapis alba]|nr:hypothetical protein N665_0054s0060 [Sinapis alba]